MRKIVVYKCLECPFVRLYYCELEHENKSKNHYFCGGDGHFATIDDLVDENIIPEWCPLEKED